MTNAQDSREVDRREVGRRENRRELLRWTLCGAIVLAAHGGLAAAFIEWHDPMSDAGDPGTGTVMIELSPLPVTPEVQNDLPPGPEQVQADPTPDKPVEKTEQKVEPLPEQPSETVVAPTPDTTPQPPHDDTPPAPTTTAPQMPRARAAAVRTWQTQIVAMLERNKRFPSEARARGEQGVVVLAFTIDREGRVLSRRIVTSSGSAALDQETLALVQRAQPFPVPPDEIVGRELSFTVPIRFSIR
jgi:protein TonB